MMAEGVTSSSVKVTSKETGKLANEGQRAKSFEQRTMAKTACSYILTGYNNIELR